MKKVFIQYKKECDLILNWFHIIDHSRGILYNVPIMLSVVKFSRKKQQQNIRELISVREGYNAWQEAKN